MKNLVIRQSLEYQKNGTVEMLAHQDNAPYYASRGVDELLRIYPPNGNSENGTVAIYAWIYRGETRRAHQKKGADR